MDKENVIYLFSGIWFRQNDEVYHFVYHFVYIMYTCYIMVLKNRLSEKKPSHKSSCTLCSIFMKCLEKANLEKQKVDL
jgi:hypothetical protein